MEGKKLNIQCDLDDEEKNAEKYGQGNVIHPSLKLVICRSTPLDVSLEICLT